MEHLEALTDEIEIDLTEKYFAINLNDISNSETVEQNYLVNDLENFSAYLTSIEVNKVLIFNSNNIQLRKQYSLILDNKVELFASIIISWRYWKT